MLKNLPSSGSDIVDITSFRVEMNKHSLFNVISWRKQRHGNKIRIDTMGRNKIDKFSLYVILIFGTEVMSNS